MAGVGKLLKQAQKMQNQISKITADLEARVIDVTSGGGAIKIQISGTGQFIDIQLDPEFLKEDAKLVSETLLGAVKEAAQKAKALNEEEMSKATAGLSMPGFF